VEGVLVFKGLVVLNQVAVVLGSVVQLRASIRSEPLTKRKIAESLLGWSLPLNVEVLEILWFVRCLLHRFFRESDEPRPGSRPVNRVSFQAAAA
jgi:hypothetical protein